MIEDALVIVPAYNESEVIERTLQELTNYARHILVVDDGSTDDTFLKARKFGIELIRHSVNLGYGSALKTGFIYGLRKTSFPYFITFDADGQHNPKYLEDLLKPLQNNQADYVIGSRYLQPRNISIAFARRAGSWFFASLTSLLIKKKITDPTSGLVALNRSVAKVFTSKFFPLDFPDADVLIMLDKMGFKIKEVPVQMRASQRKGSMHSGIFKPIYYFLKMGVSIVHFVLRTDLKEKRRELESVL